MKTNIGIGTAAGLLILAGGCAMTMQDDEDIALCSSPCPIVVEIPDDETRAPHAPNVTRVTEGDEVVFQLKSQDPTTRRHRMVLAFSDGAFERRGEQIHSLELGQSGDTLSVHAYDNHGPGSVCPNSSQDGCHYVLINLGNPTRPAVISSPRIIIDPR